MAKIDTTATLTQIVKALEPLPSEDRKRVIQAALTLLGETPLSSQASSEKINRETHQENDSGDSELPSRAASWLKQNGLDVATLQHVFHMENGAADIIVGEMVGKNAREKTHNAYVLAGISKLLTSGDPKFDDKFARKLCESLGCYDSTNHATHLKNKGNELTGSKSIGWTLTAPGLKRGAALVKELTAEK